MPTAVVVRHAFANDVPAAIFSWRLPGRARARFRRSDGPQTPLSTRSAAAGSRSGRDLAWAQRIIIIILFMMNLQINHMPPPPPPSIRQYFRRRRGITWEAYIPIIHYNIILYPYHHAARMFLYCHHRDITIYLYHSIVGFVYTYSLLYIGRIGIIL